MRRRMKKNNRKKKQKNETAFKVDVTPLDAGRADELLRIMQGDPGVGSGGVMQDDGYFDDCPICVAMRQWERDDQMKN